MFGNASSSNFISFQMVYSTVLILGWFFIAACRNLRYVEDDLVFHNNRQLVGPTEMNYYHWYYTDNGYYSNYPEDDDYVPVVCGEFSFFETGPVSLGQSATSLGDGKVLAVGTVVDAVYVSMDYGETWALQTGIPKTENFIRQWVGISVSSDATLLVAVWGDFFGTFSGSYQHGDIYINHVGHYNWAKYSVSQPQGALSSVAVSSDGHYIVVTEFGGNI